MYEIWIIGARDVGQTSVYHRHVLDGSAASGYFCFCCSVAALAGQRERESLCKSTILSWCTQIASLALDNHPRSLVESPDPFSSSLSFSDQWGKPELQLSQVDFVNVGSQNLMSLLSVKDLTWPSI